MTGPHDPRFSEDPVEHRARQRLLAQLAANPKNAVLAEMARELLHGRLTPRQVFGSSAYSEALNDAANRFSTWYTSLSEAEKAAAARRGAEQLQELGRDDEASTPPARRPRPRPAPEEDEDFADRNWGRRTDRK